MCKPLAEEDSATVDHGTTMSSNLIDACAVRRHIEQAWLKLVTEVGRAPDPPPDTERPPSIQSIPRPRMSPNPTAEDSKDRHNAGWKPSENLHYCAFDNSENALRLLQRSTHTITSTCQWWTHATMGAHMPQRAHPTPAIPCSQHTKTTLSVSHNELADSVCGCQAARSGCPNPPGGETFSSAAWHEVRLIRSLQPRTTSQSQPSQHQMGR